MTMSTPGFGSYLESLSWFQLACLGVPGPFSSWDTGGKGNGQYETPLYPKTHRRFLGRDLANDSKNNSVIHEKADQDSNQEGKREGPVVLVMFARIRFAKMVDYRFFVQICISI